MNAAVEAVTVEFSSDTPSGRGSAQTRLAIDGQDITKFCRSFTLTSELDSVVTATIGVLPRKGFDLKVQAAVTLNVTAMPGFILIEEVTEQGKRWRVERE